MKLVYSAGKHAGAAYQLSDFLHHNKHSCQVAAYHHTTNLVRNFHWTLDVFPHAEYLVRLKQDIIDFAPDIIIIDNEPIIANIAAEADIPIIYCSSIRMLDGIMWQRNSYKATAVIERERKCISKLPEGMLTFMYAPYECIMPLARPAFEWIFPYAQKHTNFTEETAVVVCSLERENKLRKQMMNLPITFCRRGDEIYNRAGTLICDAKTSLITDALVNGKSLILIPDLQDTESILNISVLGLAGYGIDLGQIELMGEAGRYDLESYIERGVPRVVFPAPPLHSKTLHERIDEL